MARHKKRSLWAALAMLFPLWVPSAAGAGPPKQGGADRNQVRAAFLLNFTRFVTWPGENAGVTPPLVVGIVDDPELASALERVAWGQTVRGRPLVVHLLTGLSQLQSVNMIFFSPLRQRQMEHWLIDNADSPILTVSDAEGFCGLGGMIELYSVDRRERFEINQHNLERSGLHASSKLLALSRPAAGGH